MSFKAKNLSYEANEPAFLRKLRAGVASGDTDRHERPIARPQRLKRDEDEDDGPTYVLEESGESISKAEYEARQRAEEQGPNDGTIKPSEAKPSDDDEGVPAKTKDHGIEIGQAQRKRKAGKVVGDSEADGKSDDDQAPRQTVEKPAKKQTKKKAKVVKLSFDDD